MYVCDQFSLHSNKHMKYQILFHFKIPVIGFDFCKWSDHYDILRLYSPV